VHAGARTALCFKIARPHTAMCAHFPSFLAHLRCCVRCALCIRLISCDGVIRCEWCVR
jgi:hypothetical protein